MNVIRLTGDDCDVLSVDENQLAESVSVFPNPAQDVMNISLGNLQAANMQVSIYSITGQLVLEPQRMQGNVVSLNVSELSAGLYMVQIQDTDSGIFTTKRLIIQ